MLGSLSGIITARLDQRILIEVDGVGYWVHTGSWQPTGEVTCYLYHHVREDASTLFGFPDIPTLVLFERLISISGVGPKAGLALLSIGSADRVQQAIRAGDATFLALAPGVGQKAAQKIILELKGKLPEGFGVEVSSLHHDVTAALESLGYKSGDIQPLLGQIPAEHIDLNAQIKWVLQQLSQ
jgi:Holliday junction DNA helicase RuvA